MSSPVLELFDLACERDDRILFAGLNLSVKAGEALQLRGANGAGKTTLLRCIAGFRIDYAGHIRIHGDGSDDSRAGLLFCGHRPGLSAALTAAENLAWFGALGGVHHGKKTIAMALARVGLAHWDDIPCRQMSAGQQRRVGLARLVLGLNTAGLWLLDEPFTALDEQGRKLLLELLREQLGSGGALIFATHQMVTGLAPLGTLHMAGAQTRLETPL